MSARAESLGFPIIYGPDEHGAWAWRWADTLEPLGTPRPCANCGKTPGIGGIDPCIIPMVDALNAGGIETVASCCGHGHRPGNIILADGRWLTISPDHETAHRIEALFPLDINGAEVAS